MIYTLENNNLKIQISSLGAELQSIFSKDLNQEFLWNGNPKYWKYRSPVLFPIVGKLKDDTYQVNGKNYSLPQHGFARISEFQLSHHQENEISFELQFTEELMKIYPYKFLLKITYCLEKNRMTTKYEVKNLDQKTIYFSIGGHPAFLCPFQENDSLEDYWLEFNCKETADYSILNPQNGLLQRNKKDSLFKNGNQILLSQDLFQESAIIFEKLNSSQVRLKSKKNSQSLVFDFKGFSHFAIWTKPEGAPFLCLEPWFGHADYEDTDQNFVQKPGIISLNENKTFQCSYSVTIL